MYAMKVFRKKIVNDKTCVKEIIGEAKDVTGKTPENFKCHICMNLVDDPCEC